MKTYKKGYYTADMINGVCFSGGILCINETEELSPDDFYSQLNDDLGNDEITAFFGHEDLDLLSTIENEYGIDN